jgi:hypothetical protein
MEENYDSRAQMGMEIMENRLSTSNKFVSRDSKSVRPVRYVRWFLFAAAMAPILLLGFITVKKDKQPSIIVRNSDSHFEVTRVRTQVKGPLVFPSRLAYVQQRAVDLCQLLVPRLKLNRLLPRGKLAIDGLPLVGQKIRPVSQKGGKLLQLPFVVCVVEYRGQPLFEPWPWQGWPNERCSFSDGDDHTLNQSGRGRMLHSSVQLLFSEGDKRIFFLPWLSTYDGKSQTGEFVWMLPGVTNLAGYKFKVFTSQLEFK